MSFLFAIQYLLIFDVNHKIILLKMNKDFHITQKSPFRNLIKPSKQAVQLEQLSSTKFRSLTNSIKNIFTSPVYSDSPVPNPHQTFYSVVGDNQFKEKYLNKTLFTDEKNTQQTNNMSVRTYFYNSTKLSQKARQKKSESMYQTKYKQLHDSLNQQQTTAFIPKLVVKTQMSNTMISAWNNERSYQPKEFQKSVTKTIDKDDIIRKLSLDQQLKASRDRRSMNRLTQYQNVWNAQNKKIMRLSKRSSTMMKDTFKKVYSFPNPDKIELINDNIPEYWKQSLRNNNKRLKCHLKGHQFKHEVAEEMLQTIKGTKKIEKSMAKILKKHIGFKQQTINNKISLRGSKCPQKYIDSSQNNMQFQFVPKILLEQVHKIQYNHSNKWMGLQNN